MDDIDAQRRKRRRELYRRDGVTFSDDVVNGFWVVKIDVGRVTGRGAAKLSSRHASHLKATDLAIQNLDRKNR